MLQGAYVLLSIVGRGVGALVAGGLEETPRRGQGALGGDLCGRARTPCWEEPNAVVSGCRCF